MIGLSKMMIKLKPLKHKRHYGLSLLTIGKVKIKLLGYQYLQHMTSRKLW